MQEESGQQDGRLDHMLQLGMMVLFWHISVIAIVAWGASHVEQDVLANVTSTLRESGFRNVGVVVEGREVFLSGDVQGPTEQQRVVAVAAMVPGTRLVDASGLRLVAPPSGSPASDGSSHLETAAMDKIHTLLHADVAFAGPTSSRLTDPSRLALAEVARLLVDHPSIRGVVEARTTPDVAASSPGLAERRANVVLSYLLGSGIATDRVTAKGEEGAAAPDDPDALGFIPEGLPPQAERQNRPPTPSGVPSEVPFGPAEQP